MSDERSDFGQVYENPPGSGRWFAKFPNGRRTPSGRCSYDVRKVPSEATGWKFLREIAKAKREGALAGCAPSRRQGAMTLSEAIDAYVVARVAEGLREGTREQYQITAKAVRASGLGAKPVGQVTPDDMRAFLSWRRSHVWRVRKGEAVLESGTSSPSVLYRDRGLVGATYRWLAREDPRAPANPVEKVKPPRKPETSRRPFEPKELEAFLAACGPSLRPLATVGFYSALGEAELIGLRWRDVGFARETLTVVRVKTGKAIEVQMHPRVLATLKALREERTKAQGIPASDAFVFLSRTGHPFADFPYDAWRNALGRAGLGRDLTPHSMRRSFATFWEGTERDLMELLGHASLSTTLIYRRGRDERKRQAVKAFSYGLTSEGKRPAAARRAKASGG